MENLLFAARKLVQSIESGTDDPEGHHPDLPLPEQWQHIPTLESFLEIREIPIKGQGFVAKQNLPAGTLLMAAKPISMVLDSEEEEVQGAKAIANDSMEDDEDLASSSDANDEEKDPHVNELLLLEVLDQLNTDPSLWENALSKLYPRTEQEVAQLPAYTIGDDEIFEEFEKGILTLEQQHEVLRPVAKEISKRLPLLIRYNILSMETCPELLSYPGSEGYANLAGVGLYHLPSFFNHSKSPNCARYAIGDIMCFVTNQDIPAGSEVCISYIEHDILCESAYRRNLMLSMNFDDRAQDDHDATAAEKEGPEMPVVDGDVQNELMTMDPLERLASIDELLAQATGQKRAEDEVMNVEDVGDDAMDGNDNDEAQSWFQCDIQNLRILKAITLESLGQSRQALSVWEEAIHFCDTYLPPNDENGIVVRTQAAISAYLLGESTKAQAYASSSLQMHNLLFGGGVGLFRVRMGPDLRLSLRPGGAVGADKVTASVDALWPR